MNNKREAKFPLEEDSLKYSLFTKEEKDKIENKIENLRVDILNEIKNENNYINKIVIKEFFNNNKEFLDSIIL